MVRIILYEEACEVLNLHKIFRDDVRVVAYIKNNNDYFGNFIDNIRVYSIQVASRKLSLIEFDYIIINSRYSRSLYEQLKIQGVSPEFIIDVSFLNDDDVKKCFKDKLIYCRRSEFLDFETLFIGKNYIEERFLSKHFNDYLNVSNKFLDVHYNYHLLYYLVKNNKIGKRIRIGFFINYSMMYENVDLLDDRRCFIKIFEDVFNIHNLCNLSSTYYDISGNNFKNSFNSVFNLADGEADSISKFSVSESDLDKVKYDTQIETINYDDSNMVAFKMNKNIISQMLKFLYDNNITIFFIVPPVHKEYRTYINRTLRNEFYSVINKYLSDRFFIFDYFNFDLDANCFCSPTNLNFIGCDEFLKLLSLDIKDRFVSGKLCNDL